MNYIETSNKRFFEIGGYALCTLYILNTLMHILRQDIFIYDGIFNIIMSILVLGLYELFVTDFLYFNCNLNNNAYYEFYLDNITNILNATMISMKIIKEKSLSKEELEFNISIIKRSSDTLKGMNPPYKYKEHEHIINEIDRYILELQKIINE